MKKTLVRKGSFGRLPVFDPPGDPIKIHLKMPHLKAQHKYLKDLCIKYDGIMNLCELAKEHHKNIHKWMKGECAMSTEKAKMLEDVLNERLIKFPDYLKREWA